MRVFPSLWPRRMSSRSNLELILRAPPLNKARNLPPFSPHHSPTFLTSPSSHRQIKWLIVRRLPLKAYWGDAPLVLWDLAVEISITKSKFPHSMTEAQLLSCSTSLRLQIPCTGNPPTLHIYSKVLASPFLQ